MKKYIITGEQLNKIVERVETEELPTFTSPDPDKTDSEYTKEIEPLTWGAFLNKSGDIKSNVTANVSANRAQSYIDKAEDNLIAIAGKNYKGITSQYNLNTLNYVQQVSTIIITIAYFIDKKRYNDVELNYDKNKNYLTNKNLNMIKNDNMFKNTQVKNAKNPNDPNDNQIYTLNHTIVAHFNAQKQLKKIEFNNILLNTINEIVNYFNDKKNMDFINDVLSKKIRSVKKEGNKLIVI